MIRATDRGLVTEFFNARLGLHRSEDFRGVLWVPDEYECSRAKMEDVAVAVGYNAFIGRTCAMHTVIQRPDLVNPRMVREAFEFPFIACDCNAVLALVDSNNIAALTFDKKLGFKEIARVPDGGPEGDLVILRMLRGECRWLKKPH